MVVEEQEPKWRFPLTNNTVSDGFNEASIEIFAKDFVKANTREPIQNLLDQRVDKSKPARVDVQLFKIQPEDFPGCEELKECIHKCIDTVQHNNANDTTPLNFYEQALQLLEKPISVLRISDYNTTGLIGADTAEIKQPWYSLVKGRGISNKNGYAGGSYGIGKFASMGCSLLRTIVYASKSGNVDSWIGVSRLQSFINGYHKDKRGNQKPDMTVGMGYYSDTSELDAILEPYSLNGYTRDEDGTDIYIFGIVEEASILQRMVEEVLFSFCVSIHEKQLVATIGEAVIDHNSLPDYIARLEGRTKTQKARIDCLREQYDILRHYGIKSDKYRYIKLNTKEFGAAYGIEDGECELMLKIGEDLNSRILITRANGMALFQNPCEARSSMPFTGILRITGKQMSSIFRSMEVPTHDKWIIKESMPEKEKKICIDARRDLYKYIVNKVEKNFPQNLVDEVAAFDMDEFFIPDTKDEGRIEVAISKRKVAVKVQRDNVSNKRPHKPIKPNLPPSPPTPPNAFPWPTPPNPPEPTPPVPPAPSKPKDKIEWKFRDVKKRLICRDKDEGRYVLLFKSPVAKKKVRLNLVGIQEKGSQALEIHAAEIPGMRKSPQIQDNDIVFGPVKSNQEIEVFFTLEMKGLIRMEVNYYENK